VGTGVEDFWEEGVGSMETSSAWPVGRPLMEWEGSEGR
jgi:hypothetical protein